MSDPIPAPRVFTIPPGISFVDGLAAGLMARDAGAQLADTTILLPNRRACRGLSEAFLRITGGRPLLLPRMLPLGEVEEDELILAEAPGAQGALDLPPAMEALRRQLLLSRLVRARDGETSLETALDLAAELARFLDQVHTEELPFERLETLVPAELASHWRDILQFLDIVTKAWPLHLEAENRLDPARRRALLQAAQAEAWQANPPSGPVIAAGSTGTVPATARLIAVVAGLPQGAVVLPGLDRHLSAEAWDNLHVSHPQFGMHRMLGLLGLGADQVADWPCPGVPAAPSGRSRLISAAMWPADAKDRPDLEGLGATAWTDLRRFDCATSAEEAQTIALLMRETLEIPDKTAALVTPDRNLARRVAAELRRWGIVIDDSGGLPLNRTEAGAFLSHVAHLVADDFAPLGLLAMAKHPLAAAGRERQHFLSMMRGLEKDCLRGPRPDPGLASLRRLPALDGQTALRDLLGDLARWSEDLSSLLAGGAAPWPQLVEAHMRLAERLAADDQTSGADRLWSGEGGEAASRFVAELLVACRDLPPVESGDYPDAFDLLLSGVTVRPRQGLHPRLAVLGLLEARLHHADLMILGGLNEGTWPPDAPASPWMSRPMLEKFGLPAPERRVGLTAHDFAQALGAHQVAMTRAERSEGTPTVPSRWLRRLENVLAEVKADPQILTDHRPGTWRRGLDRPGTHEPRPRPQPRPPLAARPRELSVTQIETLMRDPYAIYARKILKLEPLQPLDASPNMADYGNFIHQTLEAFVMRHPGPLPADGYRILLELGREKMREAASQPGVWAFWWPRFERIADWFLRAEADRRPGLAASQCEKRGVLELPGPAGPFRLKAYADRIDHTSDGRLVIIDYKTGGVPSDKQVNKGYAPQLPLEAAIARTGGFKDVPAAVVGALEFWRLSGARPAGEVKPAGGKDADPMALADQALEKLTALIRLFDNPDTPYEARNWPHLTLRYNDYDHLERLREWSSQEDGQ